MQTKQQVFSDPTSRNPKSSSNVSTFKEFIVVILIYWHWYEKRFLKNWISASSSKYIGRLIIEIMSFPFPYNLFSIYSKMLIRTCWLINESIIVWERISIKSHPKDLSAKIVKINRFDGFHFFPKYVCAKKNNILWQRNCIKISCDPYIAQLKNVVQFLH